MIEPVNNVVRQEGDTYLVLPNGHFNNVFPKETHPTLFTNHRTYIGFLHDSNPPTVYQVMRWNSTPFDEPVSIRRLSVVGAKRIHSWVNPMLQSYVDKANSHMQEHIARFRDHLKTGAIVEAEKDIEATMKSLEITVGLGFPYPYVKLPEGLYGRLETCPQELQKDLTPEAYKRGVSHYMEMARNEGNRGWSNAVNTLCDNAQYCAEKGFEADSLQSVLDSVQEIREESLSTARSIEQDREIASRFSWRRPNSRESWLVAELGFDPFPQPTARDYAEISAAKQRLQNSGL
jgi:hypothetical protein